MTKQYTINDVQTDINEILHNLEDLGDGDSLGFLPNWAWFLKLEDIKYKLEYGLDDEYR